MSLKGVPREALEISIASLTDSSLRQYNSSLRLWWMFCKRRNANYFDLDINMVLSFLVDLFKQGASYGVLNTARSALALLISPSIGQDFRIRRFLKGVFKLRPSLPKYKSVWDPSIVLRYLSTLVPNETIDLFMLAKKAVTLLALVTAHRVQTFSLIEIDNIVFSNDKMEIKVPLRIKTSSPRGFQPNLSFPFFNDKPGLCVARTLLGYLERTKGLRPGRSSKLFLTAKQPFKPASSQTLSRWIKDMLARSGIDTSRFTAHSTRHAATSAAARKGVSLDVIRSTAGWSDSSQMFAKFYNRPLVETKSVANAILDFK